jgi:hypothetical protein
MSTVTPLSENIKYLVVGIDNQSGSLTYILGDDKKYIDSATKDNSPYNVLRDVAQTPQENMQYVRVKVQKSATRPITASTDTRPYFELNQNWYTLLLDEHVTPLETSGVIDKNWFGDYGLTQDPFSFFNRRIYNKELIVQNIKYLFNLPPGESNFNEKFPEVEASKTAATLKEIQDSLVRPFFAIKTVLDMQARDNTLPKDAPPYFVNGRDRYGYPNIMGDKSHIISALQLLYDVRLYCPECIKDTSGTLKQLLNHITYRNYFLHKDDVTENIMDFETALLSAGIVTSTTAVVPGTVGATSSSIDSCWKFLKDYLDIGKVGIPDGAGIPATPSDKNIVLIRSKEVIPKVENFELIGQICQLKEMDHFIYFNYKLGMMFDDVEIRESRDRLQYIEEDKISLYRKKGRTYRDFLQTKYLLKNEDIDETLKFNKTIKFVDQFITNDPLRDGEKITEFMKQHLSLQSRRDLAATPFTGNKSRHGLCNNSGDLSYFIAAIEMIYDCVPFKYGQDFNKNVFGYKASMKKFEFMLLNTEYCLRRLFELIQTTFDPLTTETKPVSTDPKENVYFNYLICVYFLLNNLNPIINLRFPTGTHVIGDKNLTFPEYEFTTIMNNYYYKTIGSIFLDYEKTKAESFETAFSEDPENTQSTIWYPGKFFDVLALSFAGIGGPREIIEEEITEKKQTMKINERKEKATNLLLNELKKKHYITPAFLPNILQDKCVETIHKLILVISRKFNVFIDFEDDLRSLEKKMEYFKDALDTKKQPNFIIKIGSLPQKPLTTADALAPVSTGTSSTPALATAPAVSKNWLKITRFPEANDNADYANGIYAPSHDPDSYKHVNHNNVTISKNSTGKWKIVITPEGSPPVEIASESDAVGTWNIKKTLYSDANTEIESIESVKLEEIGEPYLPGPGDPLPDFIPTTSVLPLDYTINAIQYERIGTIYKSLHHDLYYKYYNEKVQTLVFDFKATNLSNPAAQLALNTKDMFPFIGLYRRTDYMTVVDRITRTDFIYQDVIQFIDKLKGQLYV